MSIRQYVKILLLLADQDSDVGSRHTAEEDCCRGMEMEGRQGF